VQPSALLANSVSARRCLAVRMRLSLRGTEYDTHGACEGRNTNRRLQKTISHC
jgi:hypothetical protein